VETRDRCREILDRLVRLEHSCLIRCHEYGIAFGALFVAADFVAEPRLADRLAAGTRFEPRAAARLLREIAGGIEACHAIGLRHGEIAPHNIALFDGRAKLLDAGHFDLARIIGRGSPWAHDYIAPEEADGGSAEARSDLYALGVLAFELATGEKPFIESNIRKLIERHRFSPPPLPRTRRPGLVRAWDDLVQGLMAKDPDKRPTLIEVKRLFEELTHADPPPPEPDKVDLAVLGERLHERARDLFELGRFDEARAPLAELLEKVETQHARGWNLLGVIELKAKRREAAARHFARALAIDCEYLEAAMNLGLACQESRRFEEAARAYAEAARIKPGQARAWLHLGECRLALKQYPTAMASWEKALQLEPGNATLRERLASLKKALG
jgi:tetratricopeptide (TPR) repeat protein